MTILSALATLYERMAEQGQAPRPGYSVEKIGGEVVIDGDGQVVKITSFPDERCAQVPAPPPNRRGKKMVSGTFWDPPPYLLGLSLQKDGTVSTEADRTSDKHLSFVEHHENLLGEDDDEGLRALLRFLRSWSADQWFQADHPSESLKAPLVFRLHGDAGSDGRPRFLHERPAAVAVIENLNDRNSGRSGLCLVTGKRAPVARLHPSFKGLGKDAQSSGAYLVSFNIGSKDVRGASSSHYKEQGDNAPVSQQTAFAYGTALNALLAKGERRHLRIGDSTVVFWAEAARVSEAEAVEALLADSLNPPAEDEDSATGKLRARLDAVAQGRDAAVPGFDPSTRVYILGLAPNAARLSVRFWHPGSFGDFARNVSRFWQDLEITPAPWKAPPAAWSLLYETALQRKAENIPPLLSGELMRAVLTGSAYPRTLLAGVIGRIRADGEINGRRAAICKAFIKRNIGREEIPVALDPDNTNPAYRLGRLFAVLERIQEAALPGLNATIKERYFAAASATPARVFPVLVKNATHHLSLMRKGEGGGLAHWMDAEMGRIWAGLGVDLPRSLNLEDQGRFVAGYYHQRWAKKEDTAVASDAGQVTEEEGAE